MAVFKKLILANFCCQLVAALRADDIGVPSRDFSFDYESLPKLNTIVWKFIKPTKPNAQEENDLDFDKPAGTMPPPECSGRKRSKKDHGHTAAGVQNEEEKVQHDDVPAANDNEDGNSDGQILGDWRTIYLKDDEWESILSQVGDELNLRDDGNTAQETFAWNVGDLQLDTRDPMFDGHLHMPSDEDFLPAAKELWAEDLSEFGDLPPQASALRDNVFDGHFDMPDDAFLAASEKLFGDLATGDSHPDISSLLKALPDGEWPPLGEDLRQMLDDAPFCGKSTPIESTLSTAASMNEQSQPATVLRGSAVQLKDSASSTPQKDLEQAVISSSSQPLPSEVANRRAQRKGAAKSKKRKRKPSDQHT